MSSGHGKHARKTPRATAIALTVSFVVAFAAVAAAVLMHIADSAATQASAPAPAAGTAQPIMQEGRLVAVTPDSLTAVGADGVARTYVIDAQTNGITMSGSHVGTAASAFAVNDEVSILGITRGGANIATVVAHRQATGGNAAPMDYALP
ncbi:hypothetical protein SBI67_07900 [Mycolicibacterium sp. 120266]|uniref:hypothetical protein n=1 Tax=Mycolicibacterium sp. 120266 TaxID=3090601 RepID=UPI00299D98A1|nr:hypothetical protein [Mycolicibacterium sp. 120266]MDX1872038.1 hypothetical protein [Mycolicibacterium sp. 120266]